MPWVKRLQRRFSPRRILLGKDSNLTLESEGSDALVCLVGRALCLFVHVDASRVPDKQQRDFVGLAVRRAAPFPDPEFGVAWGPDGRAAVWYWSRSRVEELLSSRQVRAGKVRFEPEPLYVRSPHTTGAELLALHEGFEGRVWHEGSLTASRWWPTLPTAEQWHSYVRAAGQVSPGMGAPAAVESSTQARPWGARTGTGRASLQLSGLERHLPTAALAAALLVVTIAAVETGSLLRSHLDTLQAERAAEQLDDPLKRILAAREAADGHRVAIDQLIALRAPRSLIELLAEAARLVPGDAHISQWSQPVPERVEITLSGATADPQSLVETWEASPYFEGVTTDVGRGGEIVLRALITPALPPTGDT